MELTYDWQSFQSMFYPKRRSATPLGDVANPVYLVVESSIIVSAFGECEDLSDWIGAEYQEMAAEMPHRELLLFEREQVDQWMAESTQLPHIHEQIDFLRKQAASHGMSTRARPVRKGRKLSKEDIAVRHGHAHLGNQHFLIEAMLGWWGKVLPSAFGVFVRLENEAGAPQEDIFVLIRRGRLDAFHEPDLSSMGRDRCKMPGEVVKYLSEKHLVPVQGLFVPAAQWAEWCDSPNPWRKLAASLKANESKLMPFRWSLVSLMASRAFLGF